MFDLSNFVYACPLAKAKASVDVAFADFPDHVQRHLVEYGIRQVLNDAMAGADVKGGKATTGDAYKLAMDRFANLREGTLRTHVGKEADPVKRRAKELAVEAVTKAVKAKGKKPDEVPNFKDLVAEFASRASTIEIAKAQVDQANAMPDVDIDL